MNLIYYSAIIRNNQYFRDGELDARKHCACVDDLSNFKIKLTVIPDLAKRLVR